MIDDVTTQLRRGVVEYCVIGFLAREPMYGWQLASALTDRGLIASIGTLYPLLARLRDRGLIVAFERTPPADGAGARSPSAHSPEASGARTSPPEGSQPSASGGPTRKYYRLTPLGEQQLDSFRAQWGPFSASVSEIIRRERP